MVFHDEHSHQLTVGRAGRAAATACFEAVAAAAGSHRPARGRALGGRGAISRNAARAAESTPVRDATLAEGSPARCISAIRDGMYPEPGQAPIRRSAVAAPPSPPAP